MNNLPEPLNEIRVHELINAAREEVAGAVWCALNPAGDDWRQMALEGFPARVAELSRQVAILRRRREALTDWGADFALVCKAAIAVELAEPEAPDGKAKLRFSSEDKRRDELERRLKTEAAYTEAQAEIQALSFAVTLLDIDRIETEIAFTIALLRAQEQVGKAPEKEA